MGQSWSGLLPPPDDYNNYPEDAQRKILAWNDARVIDESARSDRIASAGIAQERRRQVFSLVLNLAFLAASFAGFVLTGRVESFGFMTVPVISLCVNVHHQRRRESGDDAR